MLPLRVAELPSGATLAVPNPNPNPNPNPDANPDPNPNPDPNSMQF